ncbi:MAG: discoidin domain-containing protein, partial [Bdellovibrio sp.]
SSQLRQQGNINNTVSWTDFKSWCIAEIPFPDTVGEIKLEMSYMASLFFVDTEISTDPIISRDFRTLNYPLFPAAIWAADSFVVKLELNNSGPLELIAKPNSSGKYHPDLIKKDDKYFFEFKKSFLQKPGYLEIIFSALNLEFAQRATYNKNARESHKVPMVATANTSIEPKSKYGPQFAIDGDPNTAWCFKNNDVAPEITLNSSEKIKNRELSIIFIQVAGGYLKNQKIYEANGKPIELEVSSCDGKIKRTIKTEKPGPDYRNAWLTLKPETTQKFKDWVQEKEKNKDNNYTNGPSQWDLDKMINSGCFKIKIKKIKPGTDPDTCVSEIIPFIF